MHNYPVGKEFKINNSDLKLITQIDLIRLNYL